MEIVPLLERAHSPRLTPDNNATDACDIRKYACYKKTCGCMFLYCLVLICELKKNSKKLKLAINAQIIMVYLSSNPGLLIS